MNLSLQFILNMRHKLELHILRTLYCRFILISMINLEYTNYPYNSYKNTFNYNSKSWHDLITFKIISMNLNHFKICSSRDRMIYYQRIKHKLIMLDLTMNQVLLSLVIMHESLIKFVCHKVWLPNLFFEYRKKSFTID